MTGRTARKRNFRRNAKLFEYGRPRRVAILEDLNAIGWVVQVVTFCDSNWCGIKILVK
jgi:hypothetical protein